MLTYNELKLNAREFLSMTSVSVAEFEGLLPAFEIEYALAHPLTVTSTGQPRRRKAGGGRKSQLATAADKLLFILTYQKVYMLQTAHGLQFDYSQSRTNELLHDLFPILQKSLSRAGYAPLRAGAALSEEPPQAYQIDGTERRRLRPQNATKQRECYSGKQQAHTEKNILIIATRTEMVAYLSPTVGGAQHDKKAADVAAPQYPAGSTLTQDAGFQAYAPAGVHTIQPTKKKRGRELSLYERLANRLIAQSRILIEHILARIKRCRIVKDVFRNTKAGLADVVLEIACGLHNLRTDFRLAHSPAAIAAHIYFR